jgi:hypothetical protein
VRIVEVRDTTAPISSPSRNGSIDVSRMTLSLVAVITDQQREEPVEPLDDALHAEVAQAHAGPLATGENLFSTQDARTLLRHGGLRSETATGCSSTAR